MVLRLGIGAVRPKNNKDLENQHRTGTILVLPKPENPHHTRDNIQEDR